MINGKCFLSAILSIRHRVSMSILTLVRHGQASFLEKDYDQLSSLGEKQARALGEFWVGQNFCIDHVFSGPRIRHIRSCDVVGQVFQRTGLRWPKPVVIEEFDEYQAESLMRVAMPLLRERDERINRLNQSFRQSEEPNQRRRAFERLFQAVTSMWVRSEFVADGIESWQDFCRRVPKGVERAKSASTKSQRIVVFTSSGPIAVAAQLALGLSAQKTLELSWMMHNGAYAEFLFAGDRFSLSTFNASPHLRDPSLLTYR